MSRHRNVRQFGIDDVSIYDEALASSVDDDYGISPNTAERYIYSADKRSANCVMFFGKQDQEPLKISEEEFPVRDNTNEEYSPGYITGRIRSDYTAKSPSTSKASHSLHDLDTQDLILGTMDDQMKPNEEFKESVDTSLCGKLSISGGRNTIPVMNNLEEMDFESFECMTMDPTNAVFTNPQFREVAHTKSVEKAAVFSSDYAKKLKEVSERVDCLKFSAFTHSHPKEPLFEDPFHISSSTTPGSKRPSNLGSVIVPCSKLMRESFDYTVFRLYQSFIRSRGTTILTLTCPKSQILKAFAFDIAEPMTFEKCRASTIQRSKLPLPAPRKKRNMEAYKNDKNKGDTSTSSGNLPLGAESVQLAETLSQKLNLAAQSKNSSTPVRLAANGAITSPSKPIDRKSLLTEYEERRKYSGDKDVINLIVVGHVDAGKSTLMGNLLYQLGHVSGKQLAKYRWDAQKLGKASFAYAWVLDQTTEERNRGVTMDIAQTSFETATKRIALMDAPGHKDFVPRVIGGASQADAALLVINATNGEFETGFGPGGQTREHARLARLLGVSHLIVAVNKMDTVDWSQTRFNEIQSQMTHFLKNMNIAGVFCPVSGLTGVNLVSNTSTKTDKKSESSVDVPLFAWYTGPCLLDIIDSIPSPDRTIDGPFRFVVSDIFKPPGLSVPAVAGRILSGGVSSGVNLATSRVFCQPSGLPATVKSIRSLCTVRSGTEAADGSDGAGGLLDQVVKAAFAGDQVALILNGIDPYQSLVPGDVIADPDNPVPLASRISAKILVFTVPQPITQGYPVIFYYHCTSVGAHVTKLKSMTHKENKLQKTVKKPRCLLGNCTAEVEITLERPVCLEVYERCKPLGRFMLRVNGESIAGGTVTAVLPPKKNRLIDL